MMSLLIALIITASIVFIFLYVKKENTLSNDSSNWLGTSAVIASSNVRRDWDKNKGTPKTQYWFEVQYNYEVEKKTYLGERYAFHGNPSFKTKAEAEKLLEEFPIGKTITIYYQPDNPQESVIKR
jgi:hypothetical protein